jgi:hypothetical protein
MASAHAEGTRHQGVSTQQDGGEFLNLHERIFRGSIFSTTELRDVTVEDFYYSQNRARYFGKQLLMAFRVHGRIK